MKEERKVNTLLITGCIAPSQNTPDLVLVDAEERKKQYLQSIEWYIQKTDVQNIVYCDSSAAAMPAYLKEFAREHNKNFEWVAFQGDREKTECFGKGYGEGEIIAYALKNSSLLQNSNWFCKVTGRIIVQNIQNILKYVKKEGFYGWTSANRLQVKNPLADTRIFIADKNTYLTYFHDAYLSVRDREGIQIETVYREILSTQDVPVFTPPVFPDFIGQSGSLGIIYDTPKNKLFVKNLLCRFGFYSVRYKKKK